MEEARTPNLFQRLLGVMNDIDYIQKGDKTVNGQYKFVSHDQVTAAIHPLLVKHRVLALPSVIKMEQDGNRTSVTLEVNFVNPDNGECYKVLSTGFGIDGGGTTKDGKPIPVGDKGPGKAISYAFKYAILKTFCLETGDDPDNDASPVYEPVKCLEFDLTIMAEIDEIDCVKMNMFLEHSAKMTSKHIEDIKREAVKRKSNFLAAFNKWTPKKKEES